MTPVTREEIYLYKLAGGSVTVPTPVSRKEMYLAKACGEAVTVPDPVSREEMYLYKLSGGIITLPTPVSRLELLMAAACGETVTPYYPVSRLEWFWAQLSTQTITGAPPITFHADGQPLSAWSIFGNSQQNGTPTPDAPVDVQSCGDWDADANSYKLPITSGAQTTPIYLGQVQTVRRIKKLVLDGTEENDEFVYAGLGYVRLSDGLGEIIAPYSDKLLGTVVPTADIPAFSIKQSGSDITPAILAIKAGEKFQNITAFKSWLAENQITVWYVLANEQTGIVNEPLCKIGDYADTVASTNTGAPSIPTVSGSNTLTVGTTMQPSSVSITGHISQ